LNRLLIILLLLASLASATVEDTAPGSSSGIPETVGGTMPGYQQFGTSGTSSLPGSVWPIYITTPGTLTVTVNLTGASSDAKYITPGKTVEYTVNVRSDASSEVEAELTLDPGKCRSGWFSWTEKSVTVPSGGVGSVSLYVKPDMSALASSYSFEVFASAEGYTSGSDTGSFEIQDYDYVSETMVGGTGQFQISKDVRSMESGIKSNKDIYFSGSVDALVKNEYLVDNPIGTIPTFQENDAVDNYAALNPGDALVGTETFKSSLVFGGLGAKVQESYNVYEMEFQKQNFDLHSRGSQEKKAVFQTADNFSGYFLLDSKQIVPGQKNIKEREEFFGSFEIQRRLIFKEPTISSSCSDFQDFVNTFSG
jgi:hypothetical protein